jgi:hypothetical protein
MCCVEYWRSLTVAAGRSRDEKAGSQGSPRPSFPRIAVWLVVFARTPQPCCKFHTEGPLPASGPALPCDVFCDTRGLSEGGKSGCAAGSPLTSLSRCTLLPGCVDRVASLPRGAVRTPLSAVPEAPPIGRRTIPVPAATCHLPFHALRTAVSKSMMRPVELAHHSQRYSYAGAVVVGREGSQLPRELPRDSFHQAFVMSNG